MELLFSISSNCLRRINSKPNKSLPFLSVHLIKPEIFHYLSKHNGDAKIKLGDKPIIMNSLIHASMNTKEPGYGNSKDLEEIVASLKSEENNG